ncbi:MAG: hypothetical protein QOK49_1846 [Baekduia sp.]|jgi:hypothetical protein|nr:hypothetical protein [Baekduia sp.]
MRRNLLFFLTGALLALAAVLVLRSGDAGPPAQPAAATVQKVGDRAVRSVRVIPRTPTRHRRKRASAPGGSAPATTPAAPAQRATGPAPTPATRARATPAQPATTPAPTLPADTVPGEGGGGAQTTPAPTPTPSDQTATTGGNGGGAVTIPNQATPDASVGRP